MRGQSKIGRNDFCPCGSGKKFKHCCEGKVDWRRIIHDRADWTPYLSIRGRNILFVNKIAEALQMDAGPGPRSLKDYKKAFTTEAVKKIHESLMEVWPPDIDIGRTLQASRGDISGLYIGDYRTEYILKGLVRHSIYSTKLLVVDPFVYPTSVRDEYNPILTPKQYRTQTLKNVNFWFSLLPWIDAGIVEVIRTPADFDRKLNWDSLHRQQKKFEENEELRKAVERSVSELGERHKEEEAFRHLILSAPNEYLEKVFDEIGLEKEGLTVKDFIAYIGHRREQDPDFLEPLGPGGSSGQLHMLSSGASYDIAAMTSNLTGSYLVTDIFSKWKEIEFDREQNNAQNKEWGPFAKAFQEVELKCLNNLRLEHALVLRKEEHLDGLRAFLRKVWKSACSAHPYSEANAQLLGDELKDHIRRAEEEWKEIDRRLLRWFGAELSAGLLAAGPLIASGYGVFLAAAFASAGAITLGTRQRERKAFQTKFPAAFFLRIA